MRLPHLPTFVILFLMLLHCRRGEKIMKTTIGCELASCLPTCLDYQNNPKSIAGVTVKYDFLPDICYGTADPKQVVDLLLPKSSKSTPLIVYFHGGGFIGNDKNSLYDQPQWSQRLAHYLNKRVAVAAVNYRLLNPNYTQENLGIQKCFDDAIQAIQFLRYNAFKINVNPDKVAGVGSSAGAGIVAYLAFGDDKKDGTANQAGMSTRLKAAVLLEMQATYDVKKWETKVFPGMLTLPQIENIMIAGPPADPNFLDRIYGKPDLYATGITSFYSGTLTERNNWDLLQMIDDNDPVFWVKTDNSLAAPTNRTELFHHPNHANAFKTKAENMMTLDPYFEITGYGANKGGYANDKAFLVAKVKG